MTTPVSNQSFMFERRVYESLYSNTTINLWPKGGANRYRFLTDFKEPGLFALSPVT